MADVKSFTIRVGDGHERIKGTGYNQDAGGTLTIYGEGGSATAVYPSGQWGGLRIRDAGEAEDEAPQPSQKALAEAAKLSDEQRDVQENQTIAAGGGNPYPGNDSVDKGVPTRAVRK